MLESEFLHEYAFEDATEKESTSPMPDNFDESENSDALSIQRLDDSSLGRNLVDSS